MHFIAEIILLLKTRCRGLVDSVVVDEETPFATFAKFFNYFSKQRIGKTKMSNKQTKERHAFYKTSYAVGLTIVSI